MRIEEFDYELPEHLIAQVPARERGASRLLHLDPGGRLTDDLFSSLPSYLQTGDLLVFNDTRVIKARLHGQRDSGGKVEALIERIVSPKRAMAMVRSSHAPKPGQRLQFNQGVSALVVERRADLFLLEFDADVAGILDRMGELPLPPYISRPADDYDSERYQTVYARVPGAVAAPTAGLHFDQSMLDRISAAGIGVATVTLHVGAGTFQPVRVEDVEDHVMHGEVFEVPQATAEAVAKAQNAGGRVWAIGTTSLRALESAARAGPLTASQGETRLFIRPGYRFRVVDCLLTNFHLPRSTLLMLVSAFAGLEQIRDAYAHAVRQGYRFFSYGDAMLLERPAAGRGVP